MDDKFVREALLRWNYLPLQKKSNDELPPIFTSRQLVPAVAAELIKGCNLRKDGYDQVEYSLTRHTNVSRLLSVPHPLPHVYLVNEVYENWSKLEYLNQNEVSKIRPSFYQDGRIILMDYDEIEDESQIKVRMAFGCRFVVHADIANCFPSVYTHAISWGLVGFEHAKKFKGFKHNGEWFNRIDYFARACKRGETQGVAIGPATSNILSEAILARIDESLKVKYPQYYRYIDDYTCYCTSYQEAECFIRDLAHQLKKYKLSLNIKKTTISQLPVPITPRWINDVSRSIGGLGDDISSVEAIRLLDYALDIGSVYPDGSVLKYTTKSIVRRIRQGDEGLVLRRLLELSRYYPILIPLLGNLIGSVHKDYFGLDGELNALALENAIQNRSDGMCWSLHYIAQNEMFISHEVVQSVINSRDCFAILILYVYGYHTREVLDFVGSLDKSSIYEVDQYWILLYQLYIDGRIGNPYDDKVFDILKLNDVSFVDRAGYFSAAEQEFDLEKVADIFGG